MNTVKFNKDILSLKQSDIRRMTIECNKVNGINLSQGICDLDLPNELINGVNNAVRQGFNIYTRYDGLDELRKAISEKLLHFNKVEYKFDKEIVVTSGSSGGFFLTLKALFEKDDEIIIFQPFYGYHYNTALSLGIKPVMLNMNPEENWSIDFNELESKITQRTKAILINTPSNPSGKIFTETEISKLAALAKSKNLYIITDEIYEYITFDNQKHISPASLKEFKDIVITIGGFSKTFSITGWRIGYLCANEEIIEKIGILNDLYYICPPAPLQKAVADTLNTIDKSFFNNLKLFYQKNRDLLADTLLKKNFKVYLPAGAYYMLADFTELGYPDCKTAADEILNAVKVAAVPGHSFYIDNGGKFILRFCFAKKYDILEKSCKKLLNL